MTERTVFLREQTISSKNKIKRAPCRIPPVSGAKISLAERKALALEEIFKQMPLFIGEKELIVGTRTLYRPHEGNEDGHDIRKYYLDCMPEYLTEEERAQFRNVVPNIVHFIPDYRILLEKGIEGIISEAKSRLSDSGLKQINVDFLNSLIIAYEGFSSLIERYSSYASELSASAETEDEKFRLAEIASVCKKISRKKAENFREAVQLLWFGSLAANIESGWFVNYGRLDVILNGYLGGTPYSEAEELIECLMLKMYDQADVEDGEYFGGHEGQLVVTLGGVLPDGTNAVNDVTMMFLDAIEFVKLPEPEYNLRLNSVNPKEFLEKASSLTARGYNFVSYYNDDRFVESLTKAGIPVEDSRNYGFDLCQDVNFAGKAAVYIGANISLAFSLMNFLKDNNSYSTFEELYSDFKIYLARQIERAVWRRNRGLEQMVNYREERYEKYFDNIEKGYPVDWHGNAPTCPLPFASGLFHGSVENALDMIYECYPIKEKGLILGTTVESVNSLAAIKKVVYDDGLYSLKEVYQACCDDYRKEGQEILRRILRKAPKWGNDDIYVDSIAKDLVEFCLNECKKYRTFTGGKILSGIHQPHPVSTGWALMATPDGRHNREAVSVTMTPQSGTMKNGPTAAMRSASIFDTDLIQWNYCFMVNYYASVFSGPEGAANFRTLLTTYFENGGMQHQPNVTDAEILRKAQADPSGYKDLIVRLWGVSAHFVDLTKEVQDEMIQRFEA